MDSEIEKLVDEAQRRRDDELALGWLRYEALRTLKPYEFDTLWKRNIKGERFDDMVDELVKQKAKR